MKIDFRKSYIKSYQKLIPSLQEKAKKVLSLFMTNPWDVKLHNHALHHPWQGCRSIDVTGDYRIIFRELSDNRYEIVELIELGTHSQLY